MKRWIGLVVLFVVLFFGSLSFRGASAEAKRAPDWWTNTDGCTAAPDKGPHFNFYEACKGHDYCIIVSRPRGDAEAGRKYCDDEFRADMRGSCRKRYKTLIKRPKRRVCYDISEGYYQAVREFGKKYWDEYTERRNEGDPYTDSGWVPARGNFRCPTGNQLYYSNGATAYLHHTHGTPKRCVDVSRSLRFDGTSAKKKPAEKPTNSPSNGWVPATGNFTCPSNGELYYSNGRNAYLHHTRKTPQRCPDVSGSLRFDGSSAA